MAYVPISPSTTAVLGSVICGTGLAVSGAGVLSATNASGSFVGSVKLTSVSYTALTTDYYIGATTNNITITLPLGIVGQEYIVKNQVNGSIAVTGTGGQTINATATKILGAEDALNVIFDGARWNII